MNATAIEDLSVHHFTFAFRPNSIHRSRFRG
jgi:hypothetical protein